MVQDQSVSAVVSEPSPKQFDSPNVVTASPPSGSVYVLEGVVAEADDGEITGLGVGVLPRNAVDGTSTDVRETGRSVEVFETGITLRAETQQLIFGGETVGAFVRNGTAGVTLLLRPVSTTDVSVSASQSNAFPPSFQSTNTVTQTVPAGEIWFFDSVHVTQESSANKVGVTAGVLRGDAQDVTAPVTGFGNVLNTETAGSYRPAYNSTDGLVYYADTSGGVHAYDATTGSLNWSNGTANVNRSRAGVRYDNSNSQVYVYNSDRAAAFDATTGNLQWETSSIGETKLLEYSDGKLLLGGFDGVIGVNPSDGSKAFENNSQSVRAKYWRVFDDTNSGVLWGVADDNIFSFNISGNFYENTTAIGPNGSANGGLVRTDFKVHVGGDFGFVGYSDSLNSLEYETKPGSAIRGGLAAKETTDPNIIYGLDKDGRMHAVDDTGTHKWSTYIGTPFNTLGHPTYISDSDTVLVPVDQQVVAFDGSSGEIKYQMPIGGNTETDLRYYSSDNALYFGAANGAFGAFVGQGRLHPQTARSNTLTSSNANETMEVGEYAYGGETIGAAATGKNAAVTLDVRRID